MVASPSRWRGPQVRAPWRHGAMGPSVSRDPWTRPVARAGVGTHECTQIGENGLSAQPPLACRVRPLVRLARRMRLSVTSPVQNALFREGDTPRVRLSVASPVAGWGACARCRAVAGRRGDAGVYTNRRKCALDAVFGHLCTLLRRDSRYESRRELRQVARAPQPPRRAGSALAGPSRLVGKTGSERVALLPGWHLRQGVNPPTFSPDVPLCHPLETARGQFYGLMAV